LIEGRLILGAAERADFAQKSLDPKSMRGPTTAFGVYHAGDNKKQKAAAEIPRRLFVSMS